MTVLVALVLVAVIASVSLQCLLYVKVEKALKPKPIGRPRGSKNKPVKERIDGYFGPSETPAKRIIPDDEMAEIIKYVNEGVIKDEETMIDPNDEFRPGTQYAGT